VGHVTLTTPLLGNIYVISMLEHDIAYLCTKVYHYSSSRSRDMVGAHQNSNGSRELTTPLWGKICHPWASYDQPTYQIWTLYLHPLWRHERQYKIWKMGWLGV